MQRPHLFLLALLALLAPGLTSCRTHRLSYTSPAETVVLSSRVDASGRGVDYVLVPGGKNEPAIHRVGTQALETPYLGFTPASIDRELAASRGLEPWTGVHVRRVERDAPASAAGLERGDVLLSIGGVALTSAQQAVEVVTEVLRPGEMVDIVFLRGSVADGWTEVSSSVEVGTKAINETTTDRFPLAASSAILTRTGLEVATIDAVLAEEIWGTNAPRAIVTGVITGSAAYHAGIRKSDEVIKCNGESVVDALDLERALNTGEPALHLGVQGPLGYHFARVPTDGDVNSRYEFNVPILLDHSSSIDSSSTSFLDFIFQFGFNKRHRYLASADRGTKRRSSFSMLPLGMFEYSRTPTSARTTIFWLISWSTRR